MASPAPAPVSLVEAARRLGGDLVGTVQDRVELLAVELQEEKLRLTQMFIWASFVVFAGIMALTFGTLTIVVLCGPDARAAVLVAFALLYGGAAVGLVLAFRRFLRRQPLPLQASLEELQKDAACIPPPN
jgi:uncharacterized membrane protein YqjE